MNLNYLFILKRLYMLLLVLIINSCCMQKELRIGEVTFNECVPNEYLVDYIEQMKYLAIKDTSNNKKEKRQSIIEIERRIHEARKLLEDFRKKYGYGNCEVQN